MSEPWPDFYWCIADPEGHLIHTTISYGSDAGEDSIEEFLKIEQTFQVLFGKASKDWAAYLDKGYRVAKVHLIEAP